MRRQRVGNVDVRDVKKCTILAGPNLAECALSLGDTTDGVHTTFRPKEMGGARNDGTPFQMTYGVTKTLRGVVWLAF